MSKYRQPTYHFHEIVRVPSYPSRHYGEVQWVFSPSVQTLALAPTDCDPFDLLIPEQWVIGYSP